MMFDVEIILRANGVSLAIAKYEMAQVPSVGDLILGDIEGEEE